MAARNQSLPIAAVERAQRRRPARCRTAIRGHCAVSEDAPKPVGRSAPVTATAVPNWTRSVGLTAGATVAVMLLLGGSAALAQAPNNCTPIRFARGQSSATVKGSVGSDEPFPCYTLATGKGQTATFKFDKTNGNMAFSIDGVVDDRDSYSFLTAARTYKFSIFQTMRATPSPFALTVSVK